MRILTLVIDDMYEYETRPSVEKIEQGLRNEGYQMRVTMNGNTFNSGYRQLEEDYRIDLVLLDFQGVGDNVKGTTEDKYKNAARQVRRIKELRDIPVFVISQNRESSLINYTVAAGANGFIAKQELPDILPFHPSQDDELNLEYLNDTVRSIIRSVNQYQPAKRSLYSAEIGKVRKYCPLGSAEASTLRDQQIFLSEMEKIPSLKDYFPRVIRECNALDGKLCYEIPYFRYSSLRRVIFSFSDSDEGARLTEPILNKVLGVVKDNLYSVSVGKTDMEYVDKWLFRKFGNRFGALVEGVKALSETNSNIGNLFWRTIQASDIVVHDSDMTGTLARYLQPSAILDYLSKSTPFIQRLLGRTISLTHGDLHFDNILADDTYLEGRNFVLIDPRGAEGGEGHLDKAYDLGKLLFSCNGQYDFIHQDLKRFREHDQMNRSSDTKEVHFYSLGWYRGTLSKPLRGGASGAGIITDVYPENTTAEKIYEHHLDIIRAFISSFEEEDDSIRLRSYFNEALHFCTIAPLHLYENSERALSMYLRGVELVNMLYQNCLDGEYGDDIAQSLPETLSE